MSSNQDEPALLRRMLPASNTCRRDRVEAWQLWQDHFGCSVLRRFIRHKNYFLEPDDDIFQESMATAYQEVERGRYRPRPGVPLPT